MDCIHCHRLRTSSKCLLRTSFNLKDWLRSLLLIDPTAFLPTLELLSACEPPPRETTATPLIHGIVHPVVCLPDCGLSFVAGWNDDRDSCCSNKLTMVNLGALRLVARYVAASKISTAQTRLQVPESCGRLPGCSNCTKALLK